jgi:hypothetical protein
VKAGHSKHATMRDRLDRLVIWLMAQHPAINKSKEIVAAEEWEGDIRVNMTTVIGAGRVLSRRVNELERIVVRARRAFRASSDPVDARSWLFRVEVDEDQYPEDSVDRISGSLHCSLLRRIQGGVR